MSNSRTGALSRYFFKGLVPWMSSFICVSLKCSNPKINLALFLPVTLALHCTSLFERLVQKQCLQVCFQMLDAPADTRTISALVPLILPPVALGQPASGITVLVLLVTVHCTPVHCNCMRYQRCSSAAMLTFSSDRPTPGTSIRNLDPCLLYTGACSWYTYTANA